MSLHIRLFWLWFRMSIQYLTLVLWCPATYMVIGILLQSTAWYSRVNQCQPPLVLGWVTVLVCQFLLIILRMRLLTEVHGAAFAATVWISLWDWYIVQFSFFFFFNFHMCLFYNSYRCSKPNKLIVTILLTLVINCKWVDRRLSNYKQSSIIWRKVEHLHSWRLFCNVNACPMC